MESSREQNFNDYKRAEGKALELLREMRQVSPKKTDIELALLVAIFELHKGELSGAHVAKVVQGHLNELVPFYSQGQGS